MLLFVDNDIFLKLAGCDLLHEFMDCLTLTGQQIYVAPDLKYSIKNQMNKNFKGEKAENAKQLLSQFLLTVKETDILISDEQIQFLDILSQVKNVHSGEALLFVNAYFNPSSKIATGDKNCLTAIKKANHLTELQSALKGRIYTLELAMLILIQRLGFEKVNEKVVNRCIDDTVLKMTFGIGRNQENAIAGLSSYTKEFIDWLAEPQLIVGE